MFMDHQLEITGWKIGGLTFGRPVLAGGSNFLKICWIVVKLTLQIKHTHTECLWFRFHGILQHALDEVKSYWNTHYIRPSRHDTVGGVPNVLFHLPENTGAYDCSVTISEEKLLEMESKCDLEMEENYFQQYFHYVMDNQGLVYPSNHEEALHLFTHLINLT